MKQTTQAGAGRVRQQPIQLQVDFGPSIREHEPLKKARKAGGKLGLDRFERRDLGVGLYRPPVLAAILITITYC